MHRHNVAAAALSGDGARLGTGSVGGEVLVWSTRPLVPVRDLPPTTNRGKISALALSPDGSEALVAPDWKPAIERWDVAAGAQRGELAAHTGRITAIAYAPVGGLIATGGADRTQAMAPAGGDDDVPPAIAAPTVRLWRNGVRVRELSGLAQRIGAIAFNRRSGRDQGPGELNRLPSALGEERAGAWLLLAPVTRGAWRSAPARAPIDRRASPIRQRARAVAINPAASS